MFAVSGWASTPCRSLRNPKEKEREKNAWRIQCVTLKPARRLIYTLIQNQKKGKEGGKKRSLILAGVRTAARSSVDPVAN